MTKTIDKTIRSLKRILSDIEDIDADIVFDENSGIFDLGMAAHHVNAMITATEEKYQKIHRLGGYND